MAAIAGVDHVRTGKAVGSHGDGGDDVQGGVLVRAGAAEGEADDEHGGEYGGRAFGNSSSGVCLGLNVRSTSLSVTISFWFYNGRCDHQDR